MAVAVGSTSTVQDNNANSLIITAPSSIAAGDMLVCIVASSSGNSDTPTDIEITGFTKSYEYAYYGNSGGRGGSITVLYKLAVTADESATDYIISEVAGVNGKLGAAAMLRITGFGVDVDPVITYGTGFGSFYDQDVTVNKGITAPRLSSQVNILVATAWDDDSLNGFLAIRDYQITSSDSNPTWTEVMDVADLTVYPTNYSGSFAVAYAESTDTSDVTSYGMVYDEIANHNDVATIIYSYLMIATPVSDSDSNTLLTTDTTIFSQTGTSAASGSNNLLTTTTAIQSQSGVGVDTDKWTATSKPSTTWSNTNK